MSDTAFRAQVSLVHEERRITGSVFCPRCGWRIGKASSPTIEHQKRCSNCHRAIAIAIEGARVLIVVEDDVAEH